ncbi:hypothetical protein LIER_36402 [Lithospermum erythrorhizon]|uniref:Uncharacterized protein n=1 Tax=Lithospermum erythrorhizon TaxID=34254 RepID=A0AAV3P6R1_LITER
MKSVKAELQKLNEVYYSKVQQQVKEAELHLERVYDKLYAASLDMNVLIEEMNVRKKHRRLSQVEEMPLQSKSRNTCLELGDTNNKFFHSSLISRQSRYKLCIIKDATGVVLTEPNDVINEAVGYFKEIFQADERVTGKAAEYIQGRIPEHCIQALIGQPTRNEVKQAIDNMKKGKCPGPDGLSTDFY